MEKRSSLHQKIVCHKCKMLLGFQHGNTWPTPESCGTGCIAESQIEEMKQEFDPCTNEIEARGGSYGPTDDTSPSWDNFIRIIEG